MLRSRRLLQVMWSVDGGDASRSANPAAVVATVSRDVRPGSIVLLHDAHPWTPRVASSILRELRRRHLRPVTVPELLVVDPPRRGRCSR